MLSGLYGPRRDSGGDLGLAFYHPPTSGTWYWAVGLQKRWHETPFRLVSRAIHRSGQWHDYYGLPFGYQLRISRQDYHKRVPARA